MIAIIYSFLAAIGWGLFPIFDNKALKLLNNNVFALFLTKITIIAILGIIMYIFMKNKINSKINNIKLIVFYLTLSVITGTFMGHLFYIYALTKTNNVSMVITISHILPIILVSILSYLLFKEKFNVTKIIGLIICLLGLTLFIYSNE